MEVDDLAYFEVDGPVSEEERVFLSAVRRQTEGRIGLWCAREGWSELGPLLIGLHLDAPEVALLTVGVRVQDGHLHGDRLDDQSYVFPDRPGSLAMDCDGSPEALAAAAVTWFETLLRRPIVRQEWLHDGRVYAQCYVFADTGEPLVESYTRDLAPLGQPEQLIRDGHVFGRGWIKTTGLDNRTRRRSSPRKSHDRPARWVQPDRAMVPQRAAMSPGPQSCLQGARTINQR